jgi:hypothetical protein
MPEIGSSREMTIQSASRLRRDIEPLQSIPIQQITLASATLLA